MRSSTSNSDRRPWWRRISWGILGFIVLYALAEIFVFRNIYLYGLEYRSSVGQFAELDTSFRHADAAAIQYAVLGDSQSIDALRPQLLAEASGEPVDRFFNFSVSGGKAFDIYTTYLRYADRMPNLKTAIVVVNEHQINSTGMAADEKFRLFAGLRDRLHVIDKDNYGELLLGWASKAVDMRANWSKLVDAYWKGKLPKEMKWQPGGIHAQTAKDPAHLTMSWAEETAGRWFEDYDLAGYQTDRFEALLRELQKRGIRTIVLQIPRSPEFESAIQAKYAELQRQFQDTIARLAEKHSAAFTVMSNEGLTLQQHFRDVNHLNPKGAAIVSAEIAHRWL